MALYQEFMEKCILLNKIRKPDGEGGFITSWEDGPSFDAAVVLNTSTEVKIAEKQGISSIYSVTFDKGLDLGYHDIFKKESSGETFRITSESKDVETPQRASFQISQVTAEKFNIYEDV